MSFLGILMLDTQFERILGDAGNPASYPCEARTRVVDGAGSLDVVRDGVVAPALLVKFIDAARTLEAQGAFALTSTCGFLVTAQDQIAAAVNIPVMVSALSLYPMLLARRHGSVGILTASKASLGSAMRAAACVPSDAPVAGMEDCAAFADAILRPKGTQLKRMDRKAIEAFAVAQALKLQMQTPGLGAILLECGNLPPYADAIREATGLPVYSIIEGVDQLRQSTI